MIAIAIAPETIAELIPRDYFPTSLKNRALLNGGAYMGGYVFSVWPCLQFLVVRKKVSNWV